MTIHLGYVAANSTLYIPFHTFDSNGASITLTGLAVTDIEIYKNGSTTQRASDNGYVLLDTDGIDFDGLTGIHGFSVDLSDNSDAGFYAAGSTYWVVVSSVTVDTRTVSFVAATFFIGPIAANATQILGTAISTPATAGILDVNVKNIDNDAASASGTVTFPNATLASTTNITGGTITTVTNLTNAPTAGDLTATMKASVNTEVVDGLNVDTYAEPGQEAPGATISLAKKIGYLYKAFRNRKTQTSTTFSLYADDATTVDQKVTVSDNGTTYDEGEIATGP